MNKQEIIRRVAEAEGVKEEEAAAVVGELLQLITERMKSGEETQIYGFGKFGRRWWKSRTGRDPQTGEEIEIEGRWIPYWTPSDTLVEEGEPHPKEREETVEEESAESGPAEEEFADSEEPEPEEETAEEKEEEFPAEEPEEVPEEVLAEEAPPTEEYSDESSFRRTEWEPPVREKSKTPGIIITAVAVIAIVLVAVFAFRDRQPELGEQPEESTAVETLEEPAAEAGGEEQRQSMETPVTPEPVTDAGQQEPSAATPVTAKSLIEVPDARPFEFEGNHYTAFVSTYKDALHQFQDNDYIAALVMFERLQVSDPPKSYADNVQYWIGECKFGLGRYNEAIREFERVFLYPDSNKFEDALIMMASGYLRLQQFDEARKILKKFQTQYSSSPYAQLAQKWLQQYSLSSGT